MPDRIHYRIVRCDTCGLVFSNPVSEEGDLDRLYRESKFTYKEEVRFLQITYGRYLKKFERFFPAKQRLLEIGCGNGFFLEEAKNFGFAEVYGVEPSTHAAELARPDIKPFITVSMFRDGLFEPEFFDVLCVFQTFDHLPDPNTFLRDCSRCLKKGGIMFFINHNVEAFLPRILKDRCPIIDVEHTYLYSKKTQTAILEKNHFRVLETCDVANTYPLTYWLHLIPAPSVFKKGLLRVFSATGLADLPLTLKVGNMAICAQKL